MTVWLAHFGTCLTQYVVTAEAMTCKARCDSSLTVSMCELCATHVSVCLPNWKKWGCPVLGVWHPDDHSALRQATQIKLFDYPRKIGLQKKFESVISLTKAHLFVAYFTCRFTVPFSEILEPENQSNAGIQVPQIINKQIGVEFLNLNDWKIWLWLWLNSTLLLLHPGTCRTMSVSQSYFD